MGTAGLCVADTGALLRRACTVHVLERPASASRRASRLFLCNYCTAQVISRFHWNFMLWLDLPIGRTYYLLVLIRSRIRITDHFSTSLGKFHSVKMLPVSCVTHSTVLLSRSNIRVTWSRNFKEKMFCVWRMDNNTIFELVKNIIIRYFIRARYCIHSASAAYAATKAWYFCFFRRSFCPSRLLSRAKYISFASQEYFNGFQ